MREPQNCANERRRGEYCGSRDPKTLGLNAEETYVSFFILTGKRIENASIVTPQSAR
jgi:hypothetical protein